MDFHCFAKNDMMGIIGPALFHVLRNCEEINLHFQEGNISIYASSQAESCKFIS